jgi:hypothetical protein
MFLERAEGLLLDSGEGWLGVELFRSDAARSGAEAMFDRWRDDGSAGVYSGTHGDELRHGPWWAEEYGLDLFGHASREDAAGALLAWVDGAAPALEDDEVRARDRERAAAFIDAGLAALDPSEIYVVSLSFEECQARSWLPFPGDITGFVEVFGLLADRTGCLVLTATDDA